MKKSLFTKVLTVLGAAVLTLPAVLGMNNNNKVNAAVEPAKQNVVLTKYGFKDLPSTAERDTSNPDLFKGEGTPLEDVDFMVYDITADYWAQIDAGTKPSDLAVDGSFATKDKPVGSVHTTDENGQTTFENLPTTSTDKNGKTRTAVYLFVETNARAGYDKADDFWLTLPAKANENGNVYVYPKNPAVDTYGKKFQKVDSADNTLTLSDAEFNISNTAKNQFLQITDKNGNKVESIPAGFVDVLGSNYRIKWVDDQGQATTFTSDAKGEFGLNGLEAGTYHYIETKAPNGYETTEGDFTADDGTEFMKIEDKASGLLPHTGGKGIVAFVVAGVALIALGGLAYSKRRAA